MIHVDTRRPFIYLLFLLLHIYTIFIYLLNVNIHCIVAYLFMSVFYGNMIILLAYAYFTKVVLYYCFYLFVIIQLGIISVKRPRTIIWMGRYIRNLLLLLFEPGLSQSRIRSSNHCATTFNTRVLCTEVHNRDACL